MVKHIVMWDFNDCSNKLQLAKSYKEEIEGLVGKVNGLISISANYEMLEGSNAKMVLEAVFNTFEDLVNYRTNPYHRNIGDKYKKVLLINKKVSDYNIK